MAGRPLKMPGHRPISRPEDRDRPFSGQAPGRRDPRLGPVARCLSRGARGRGGVAPGRAAAEAVAAREAALRRLQRVAQAHAQAAQSWPEVRRELVDSLMHLRVLSLDVVETVEAWRAGRPSAWPDPQTGENYLLKMKDDTRWLADSPLGEILRFSAKSDPFFVVPSAGDGPPTPTNQMTPTLQAQRQHLRGVGGDDARRAVLPLQSSLLRRIRAAELVILKESVQARMQAGSASSTAPAARGHAEVAALDGAPVLAPIAPPTPRPGGTGGAALATPAQVQPVEALLSRPPAALVVPAGPRPRPPRPKETEGAFLLLPLTATPATVEEVFQRYLARVDPRMSRSMEPWSSLQQALEDEGVGAPEWFWLMRCGSESGPPAGPFTADGLVVFRLKRMSTTFGQLLHLSVTHASALEAALDVVKSRMFARQPIRSIRTTLWFNDVEGEFQLNRDMEAAFKGKRFRWFQLTNQNGIRGQVMNCARSEEEDPETPAEEPAIEVCLGQLWLRGCGGGGARLEATRGVAAEAGCPWNLVLASACLRGIWARDAAADQPSGCSAPQAPPAVRDAAREGLVRGLLSGALGELLAKLTAVGTKADADAGTAGDGSLPPAALAVSFATALEAGPNSRAVPGVVCEASAADCAAELVRRGSSAPGFAEATAGLGVEELPAAVEALAPKEVVLGRLFLTLDWLAVRPLGGGAFEVPVHAAGVCSKHPQPIFYAATSEDDTFVVVIPWEGAPQPPAPDDLFAACTRVLRATQPQESPPFHALRFEEAFHVRYAVRTTQLDPVSMGLPSPPASPVGAGGRSALCPAPGPRLHLAEFSSISVGVGREAPGRLAGGGTGAGAAFTVRRPFALCIFHTDIDDLNAPLAAGLIV